MRRETARAKHQRRVALLKAARRAQVPLWEAKMRQLLRRHPVVFGRGVTFTVVVEWPTAPGAEEGDV